jgi:uncharacterized OsmC-like protein
LSVKARWLGGYRCQAEDVVNGHRLFGDEPESLTGENTGPNPFTLLLMSLANCTVTTLVGVSREKGIDLRAIDVEVKHKQSRMIDSPANPAQRGLRMTEIRRTIVVDGDLTDQERGDLLDGAENCPVSVTLAGGTSIRTELSVAGTERHPQPSS